METSPQHLIFSTSKPALAGYAQSLRARCHRNAKMFHFSEQNGLNTDTLGEHLSSSAVSEVTVLLLATAASSYLWFDEEHCPRNVELCTFLKSHSVNVKFVVCPTTKSARDAWEQHTPNLLSVFGEFLPETGIVDVWPDFDPDYPVEPQQIGSLIRHVQSRPGGHSEHLDHPKPCTGWPWMSIAMVQVLVILWMGNQILSNQATTRLHAQMLEELQSKTASHEQKLEDLGTMTDHLKTASEDHAQEISDLQKLHTKIESHDEKLVNCDKKVEGLELSMKRHQRDTIYDLESMNRSNDILVRLDSLNRSYDSLARDVNILGYVCCDRRDA